ncbi:MULTISPECIES: ABC transporter permease [unclassified Streptococcus]|uniref:ABC transporter permease n=1 Tax=unclassified Streptococcus TaxID=2608887 RepID=UPI001071F9EC|nr:MULTISPECIES: ABC transporter permease [unclassified Streptococcus]MBF0787692.1 ABC transporter permease [Streptococcus sp. 19428wC2_LYSM12]MCQ9211237.1 ABC transporter permease [Streptococcus sp. B01]MCQ9214550.1 ABC transporter permease [Streptococcus sp. O1]TFV05301.1 multidrug ABC transporter permease [Streptococcus sp. LYSM12]
MKGLFQKRRLAFTQRCLKYLRYVLNDHFVLVLMVLLGFLALQYRALLEHFPTTPWLVYLLLAIATLLFFFSGRIATYLESADRIFLLPKEDEVLRNIQLARLRAIWLWGFVQILGQVLLLPLYLKLGWTLLLFLLYLLILTVGKYAWLAFQTRFIAQSGHLDWDKAVQYEMRRKQSILQFYSLFTPVKGLSSDVKRRNYLDPLLTLVKKWQNRTWDYLFIRSFLRSGDFFWISLRLVALSVASLLLVQESWLAAGLAVLFDYLLLFQLLPLYHAYDYQYLTHLYPVSQQEKVESFKWVVQCIMYLVLVLQLLVGILVLEDRVYLVVLAGLGIILAHLYLGLKSKKLID